MFGEYVFDFCTMLVYPVDRSVGCIFAEILLGEPLFPGQGEPDQISRIFRTIGCPNEERWPGFSSLPNASRIGLKSGSKYDLLIDYHFSSYFFRNRLRELFPVTGFSGSLPLTDCGLQLMNELLNMDPSKVRLLHTFVIFFIW
jgi:cell division cycle 2-like protein